MGGVYTRLGIIDRVFATEDHSDGMNSCLKCFASIIGDGG